MTLGIMNRSQAADQQDLIQLEPLVHQVGGHSSMFVLDDVTVCKPLIGREYQFYRTLPPEMKKYTPEFRGSLQVILREDRDGLSMAALPNEQTISLRNTQGFFKNGRGKLRRVSSSSLDFENSSSDDEVLAKAPPSHPSSTSSSAIYASSLTGEPKNPWLEECQQSHLHRLKQKSGSSNAVECIMLENLTFKFRYPCVLDLKMGTRQYGDDAPESKQRSQTKKAANTTTVLLGVRLAGMQVYNREKKCFSCKNKYYGRLLCEDSFQQTLKQFLHNGRRLQLDIMDAITTKLKELRSIISKLDSFRFFTSSLLILYDSADRPLTSSEKETGKQGDHDRENCVPKEPLAAIREDDLLVSLRLSKKSGANSSNNNTPVVTKGTSPKTKGSRGKYRAPRVDIRLIDFAHATHKGMGDAIVYKGPDEGILLGLDSLIKIFQDIRESCDRS